MFHSFEYFGLNDSCTNRFMIFHSGLLNTTPRLSDPFILRWTTLRNDRLVIGRPTPVNPSHWAAFKGSIHRSGQEDPSNPFGTTNPGVVHPSGIGGSVKLVALENASTLSNVPWLYMFSNFFMRFPSKSKTHWAWYTRS